MRIAQQWALVQDGIRLCNARSLHTPVGTAILDNDSLWRLSTGGSQVLCIPGQARELKFRFMTCAHMKEGRHGALVDALIRLQTTLGGSLWWLIRRIL